MSGCYYCVYSFEFTLFSLIVNVLENFIDGEVMIHMTRDEISSLITEIGLRHKFLQALTILVR